MIPCNCNIGVHLIECMRSNKNCLQSAATTSQGQMDAISSDEVNSFHFRYFETQLFDIFRHYNFTCTERDSVENRLL